MSAMTIDPATRAKLNAARAALDYVEPGMLVGLGSGSTAELFIELLGARVREDGLDVRGAPTSRASAAAAEASGVPLADIDHVERIDLAVDGADEVDPLFHLIKGGGGCLLREKIIAHTARHFVVVVDESKMVDQLGAFPLPVEVDPFGFTLTAAHVYDALRGAGAPRADVRLRTGADETPFLTDGGHYILDCAAGAIPDPDDAARRLRRIPGVVEHGLFIGMARTVVVGARSADGVEVLER